MRDIKRVLWVDDRPEIEVSNLFKDAETKKVSLMEDALKEISGPHLYDYDTIVFDIDFGNGLPDPDKVIDELTKKIFIKPDDRNNEFIINNGGYLLFIYLLERGYPSKQVAFLTGNPGMLEKLKDYNLKMISDLSSDEIAIKYKEAWDNAGDGDDAWDLFVKSIESLPVDGAFISDDAILECSGYLEANDEIGLKGYISSITPKPVTGNEVKNTGDMMIYRFHEANLESPAFFTKKEHFIAGHDRGEAEQWLNDARTEDRITRWLILYAGNYVKDLFDNDLNGMQNQMSQLFSGINTDPGIRSSFSQLYNLFYGLRDLEQRGPYYQAISAMLIPFDKSPQGSENTALDAGNNYIKHQRAFARFSKQARNYCAHNYFGSSVLNKTALFIILGTLSGVLSKDQRQQIDDNWYKNVHTLIQGWVNYDTNQNIAKVDSLCQSLLNGSHINLSEAFKHRTPPTNYTDYTPYDVLRSLGWNKQMDLTHEQNKAKREEYFLFTLAAYIVKWFKGMNEDNIEQSLGLGIKILFQISNEIVDKYQYPNVI